MAAEHSATSSISGANSAGVSGTAGSSRTRGHRPPHAWSRALASRPTGHRSCVRAFPFSLGEIAWICASSPGMSHSVRRSCASVPAQSPSVPAQSPPGGPSSASTDPARSTATRTSGLSGYLQHVPSSSAEQTFRHSGCSHSGRSRHASSSSASSSSAAFTAAFTAASSSSSSSSSKRESSSSPETGSR